MTTTTTTLTVGGLGSVPVTFTDSGSASAKDRGQPVLLLHGGAGPFSVAGFGELLSSTEPARVITPVHPGFDGTPRPEQLASIASLAAVYAELLRELGLTDVCVVGNSVGGWIAAELALLESAAPDRRVSSVVLVDAAGLAIDGAPIPDFFSLTLDQVFDLSYFNPDKFRIDPAALPAERQAALAANRSALLLYAGTAMGDSTLAGRLPAIAIPTLVVWGAADRMIPEEHGHAYAETIPGAQFRLITEAGHLPQLESPAELLAAVWDFASSHAHAANTDAGNTDAASTGAGRPTS
ncbi:MAG TPA: alpha/beta hydrolase [Streptosporangiaceae bacterium]|jgi:pimeloyl-ACP methyl ester carboxylesterase|nr:alpha/beta hydrolase [Streptosporangiaceae bacterium]